MLDRRILTLAQERRFLIREIGGPPRVVAVAGGSVVWSDVQDRNLFWIESFGPSCPFDCGLRLRMVDLGH
jgi:hypothetical protein